MHCQTCRLITLHTCVLIKIEKQMFGKPESISGVRWIDTSKTFTSFRDDRSTVEKCFKPSAKMIDGTDSRLSIGEVHLIECAVKNKHNSKARTFAQVRDSCQRNPEVNEKNCDKVR